MWRSNGGVSLVGSSGGGSEHSEVYGGHGASGSGNGSARLSMTRRASSISDEKMPPGWTRKVSNSQKGRYYYISPEGVTQWTSPLLRKEKAQVRYNWVHEIEIEFTDPRLGVSLREVKQYDTVPYPQFQAEVEDLPKVSGKAGPAEIYNWSVKPNRRLTIGMRITGINELSLAGFTYTEVVDKLRRSSRPVKIRFADAEIGTVEDNPEAAALQQEPSVAEKATPSEYLKQKMEYTRVLVMGELYTEMWHTENKKLTRQLSVTQTKHDTMATEFEALTATRSALQKEQDQLMLDKAKYEAMITQLARQEEHVVGNPEFIKANDLLHRHTDLTEGIAKVDAGNKRLRRDQADLQSTLDDLERILSKLEKKDKTEDEDRNDDDIFFGIDSTASPQEQLAALRKKMRFMDDELIKEQRKTATVQKEMEQLNRHLASLSTEDAPTRWSSSSTSTSTSTATSSTRARRSSNTGEPRAVDRLSKSSTSSSGSRRRSEGRTGRSGSRGSSSRGGEASSVATETLRSTDDASESSSSRGGGELPTDPAALEARILELRKQQRAVVESLAKAANTGDRTLARDCQKKRKTIKDELGRAQDALNEIKAAASASTASAPNKTKATESGETKPRTKSRSGSMARTISSREVPKPAPPEKMPTMVGFLEKGPTEWSGKGLIRNMKTMRGTRERWCVITSDGFLKYYKRRGDPVVRGEIDLSDASFEVVCEDMRRGKEFMLCSSTQQSRFFTKNTTEMQNWVKALRGANEFLQTSRTLDALSKQFDASLGGDEELPESDEFYGRATLGF